MEGLGGVKPALGDEPGKVLGFGGGCGIPLGLGGVKPALGGTLGDCRDGGCGVASGVGFSGGLSGFSPGSGFTAPGGGSCVVVFEFGNEGFCFIAAGGGATVGLGRTIIEGGEVFGSLAAGGGAIVTDGRTTGGRGGGGALGRTIGGAV